MRVNKWILFSCIIIVIVGMIAVVLGNQNTVVLNMGIGLISGAIVSGVAAILYYIYEWQAVIQEVEGVLPALYTNLSIIKHRTGMLVSVVANTVDFTVLDFKGIRSLSQLCADTAILRKLNGFCGIVKTGQTEKALLRYKEFAGDLSNLKYNLYEVEDLALEAEKCRLEILVKEQGGQIVTDFEHQQFQDKRNLVNARTAKLDEYEASLLKKLDELGELFYKTGNASWGQVKESLSKDIEYMMSF